LQQSLHAYTDSTNMHTQISAHTYTHINPRMHTQKRTNTPAACNGLIDAEPGKSGAALSCFCGRLAVEWRYSQSKHRAGPAALSPVVGEVQEALCSHLKGYKEKF